MKAANKCVILRIDPHSKEGHQDVADVENPLMVKERKCSGPIAQRITRNATTAEKKITSLKYVNKENVIVQILCAMMMTHHRVKPQAKMKSMNMTVTTVTLEILSQKVNPTISLPACRIFGMQHRQDIQDSQKSDRIATHGVE